MDYDCGYITIRFITIFIIYLVNFTSDDPIRCLALVQVESTVVSFSQSKFETGGAFKPGSSLHRRNNKGFKLKALLYPFDNQSLKPGALVKPGGWSSHRPRLALHRERELHRRVSGGHALEAESHRAPQSRLSLVHMSQPQYHSVPVPVMYKSSPNQSDKIV